MKLWKVVDSSAVFGRKINIALVASDSLNMCQKETNMSFEDISVASKCHLVCQYNRVTKECSCCLRDLCHYLVFFYL